MQTQHKLESLLQVYLFLFLLFTKEIRRMPPRGGYFHHLQNTRKIIEETLSFSTTFLQKHAFKNLGIYFVFGFNFFLFIRNTLVKNKNVLPTTYSMLHIIIRHLIAKPVYVRECLLKTLSNIS